MGHRLKAFSLHLAICCLVFAGLLTALVTWVYPQPYFTLDGGWAGLRIALAVDLVAGPLLTAVACRPGKPRRDLMRDLAVIGTVQTLFLAAGLWTIYRERPALVVFADGTFYPVKVDEAAAMGQRALDVLRDARSTPAYALIRLPADPEELARLRREALSARRPIFLRGDLLEPLDASTFPLVVERCAQKPATVQWAEERKRAEAVLLEGRPDREELVLAPLSGRFGRAYLALRRPDGRLAGWTRVTQ